MKWRIDPVTFELLRYRTEELADEALLTIVRTAHTGTIRDAMDVSVAICEPDRCEMVAQALGVPLLSGLIPDAALAIRESFSGKMSPGDVFMMNDPYNGGSHLPDIFFARPMFYQGELICYVVVVADFGDLGGRVPGGRPVDAREIYEEGIRIPPVQLCRAEVINSDVVSLVLANVRVPSKTLGDIEACLAAMRRMSDQLEEVIVGVGPHVVNKFFAQALDYGEAMTRSAIQEIPASTYEFTDYLDDGVVTEEPLAIKVQLTVVADGSLAFDFSGTDGQVPASINSTMPTTKSAVLTAVHRLMPGAMPNNSGFSRCVLVTAPAGSLVNASAPAAVASRGVTVGRTIDAVLGVLALAIPARVAAAGEGGSTSVRIGGFDDAGERFVLFDSVAGTWGARPDRDGIDGCQNFAINGTNRPVEVLEADFPVRILRYGLRPDSGGAGRFRGGLGLDREWEMLADGADFTIRADRTKFPPWGIRGGLAGGLSRNELVSGGLRNALPAKVHRRLRKGDRVAHSQAGGGGYGNPYDRAPEAVFDDWLNEKVTIEEAERAYGVVIDSRLNRIDTEATALHRRAGEAGSAFSNQDRVVRSADMGDVDAKHRNLETRRDQQDAHTPT